MLRRVLAGLRERRSASRRKYLLRRARLRAVRPDLRDLPEYYLTRTELGIMRADAPQMAAASVRAVVLIELGSGTSLKTRLLLEALRSAAPPTCRSTSPAST